MGSDGELGSVYTEIIVVRHGETAWNAQGRIQGHLDVELNDVGRLQAVAVADLIFKGSSISAVYSSDLKRALETAQTIASSCGVAEVIQDPDLRERHLGDLQGFTSDEASKLKSNTCQGCTRTDQAIPGCGESFEQLYQRCTSSLQKIGMKHIADLKLLKEETHKFESHYLDNLVGSEKEYFARSPINFVDKFSCPIILFQGLEDKVVPPGQARKIYQALKEKGLPVALVEYEGEQHGFRKAENIKFTMEQQMLFFARLVGHFKVADEITPIKIDNFD